MRAFTVRQPFASLIVAGIKNVENRTWSTNVRGKIAIHAAKQPPTTEHVDLIRRYDLREQLPTLSIIGTVEIIDCVRDYSSPWAEPGHRQFVLGHPRSLATPISCPGKLSVWHLPDEIAKQLA